MSAPLPCINIAICSCQRPRLLAKALASIAKMALPDSAQVIVSVIDNDPEQSAARVCDEWRDKLGPALHYEAEPRRGIPIARNRAIDVALHLNADYLVFIDDDEWVEELWLCELYRYALELGGRAVVHGAVIPELPPGSPAYMAEIFFEKGRPTGTVLGSCATNNVLIPMALINELDLRFDESRPLAGGTDTLFFCAAVERGAKIYECAQARVHEEIPPVRMTSRWLAKRKYRAGITLAWRKRVAGRGRGSLVFSAVGQILVNGLLMAINALLLRRAGYYKALMKASRNVGVLSGVAGAKADSYKNIEGA